MVRLFTVREDEGRDGETSKLFIHEVKLCLYGYYSPVCLVCYSAEQTWIVHCVFSVMCVTEVFGGGASGGGKVLANC